MRVPSLLRRLARDEGGSTAVEFGLLGTFMIALLLGVLQIGIAMQNYNALRGISADVSRHAVVQYQNDNELTNTEIETWARARATNPPYALPATGMTVTVTTAANQRVTGALELNLFIRTKVTSLLELIGIDDFHISYSRPIFVVNS
ncbi:hypothetical protein GCM10011371_05940 [Novosphingobium marinum]|uniref:Flp pilus assembly protein TadG n=1 Tax=Novosphingobium marinum TaxID=1514948 RepID=A0A7Z0BUK9_9SPHN|nr:TadE/TadG family type IV pilus assembly protein [Novosphingobium marinum]NYH94282.1 Flp pilus assembly protein TadG [Novosphingobium marinum]GGC21091.1 hypothetical protein GCM10011371_05940 [Novosphingobium marinum]